MERYEREDGVVVYRVSSSLYASDSISINADSDEQNKNFFVRAKEGSHESLLCLTDQEMEEFFMAWAVLRGGNR